jgi:hypothetical protein
LLELAEFALGISLDEWVAEIGSKLGDKGFPIL